VKVTVTGGGSAVTISGEQPRGGYAAGTAIKWISGLTPGQVIPLVVGRGQIVSGPGPFPLSTNSSFGAFCTGTAGGFFPTPAPGIGIGGDINITGSSGDIGGSGEAQNGGSSYWGSNRSFGAGGSGTGTAFDVDGKNGIVVVEY
jgi:hypothetical protein